MNRSTLEVLEERLHNFLAHHQQVQGEREALAARLARVERDYQDLLQRVRRYERERAEIRTRLERLLDRIGASDAT
jgi:DNA repair exonuclease SbcCD ATPase subunit